jgi:hypothetical protein
MSYASIIPIIHQAVFSNLSASLIAYLSSVTLYKESKNENYEREVDKLQMNKLLKWMNMFFDEADNEKTENVSAIKQAYRRELYSIYKTIASDYRQYEHWIKYNQSLWVFRTYRQKNTKYLAQKILSDLVLFHEGVNLFSKC